MLTLAFDTTTAARQPDRSRARSDIAEQKRRQPA
jgi:hypothetical protein